MPEWLGSPQLLTFWKKCKTNILTSWDWASRDSCYYPRVPTKFHPKATAPCRWRSALPFQEDAGNFAFTARSRCTTSWTAAELSTDGSRIACPFNSVVQVSSVKRDCLNGRCFPTSRDVGRLGGARFEPPHASGSIVAPSSLPLAFPTAAHSLCRHPYQRHALLPAAILAGQKTFT